MKQRRYPDPESPADRQRRSVLQASIAVGACALMPSLAHAVPDEDAIDKALASTSLDEVLALIGGLGARSDGIDLTAPSLAVDGAVVPVSIVSRLPETERILILVAQNPNPLIAAFDIPAGTRPLVQTRIKMDRTDHVVALVQAQGRLHHTEALTKVTLGGCGS